MQGHCTWTRDQLCLVFPKIAYHYEKGTARWIGNDYCKLLKEVGLQKGSMTPDAQVCL